MRRRVLSIAELGCAVLAFVTSACTTVPEEREPQEPSSGQHAAAISGGYEDTADKSVMALTHAGTGTLCTGSLIAPNVLLTARHCVSTAIDATPVDCAESSFGPPRAATGFFVTSADVVDLGNAGEFTAQEIVTLPGDDLSLCARDVAIVILKQNVPASVAVPYVPRVDLVAAADEGYSAAGFGAVDGADNDAGTRRRRDMLAVQCVGAACNEPQVLAGEWVGTGGVCSGDSGGPALDADNRVFGVTSRGEPDCGETVYADVSAWADWIKDSTVYASGAGVYDPPSWTAGSTVDRELSMPVGADCDSDDDCPSGRCYQAGANGYCTRRCVTANGEHSCPVDYQCATYEGELVCALPVVEGPPWVGQDRSDCSTSTRSPEGMQPMAWLFGLWLICRRRRRA